MIYSIDIDKLKECENLLNVEKNNFKNQTYNSYLSSYLKSNNDALVNMMSVNLDLLYNDINIAYSNLLNWFNNYLGNASALENYLTDEGKIGLITEKTIRNYAELRLSTLKNKKFRIIDLLRK